jgi:hypothetical protein
MKNQFWLLVGFGIPFSVFFIKLVFWLAEKRELILATM